MPMILLLLLRLRLQLRHHRPLFLPLVRKPSPVARNHNPLIYLPCSPEQDISFSVVFNEKCAILDTSSAMMDTVT